jgi:hypothetical protein
MDARKLEIYLEQRLQRLLGSDVTLLRGPERFPVLGGMRPEVHIHARSLEDFGGRTEDGAHTARMPYRGPATFRGFVEERPGRVVLTVTCNTGGHDSSQELAGKVLPALLLAFEVSPPFELGAADDGATRLTLDEYRPVLHATESFLMREEDLTCFAVRLVCHLEGTLRVQVSKRRGLKRPSPPADRRGDDRLPPAPGRGSRKKAGAAATASKKPRRSRTARKKSTGSRAPASDPAAARRQVGKRPARRRDGG